MISEQQVKLLPRITDKLSKILEKDKRKMGQAHKEAIASFVLAYRQALIRQPDDTKGAMRQKRLAELNIRVKLSLDRFHIELRTYRGEAQNLGLPMFDEALEKVATAVRLGYRHLGAA
ncbi:hypothetical protein WDW37_11845 [Bdellovibrionota bacterium FG-1]